MCTSVRFRLDFTLADPMRVPPKVSLLRQRLGLSQQELAAILQISITTVHRWEICDARPHGLAHEVLQTMDLGVELEPDLGSKLQTWMISRGSSYAIRQLFVTVDALEKAST